MSYRKTHSQVNEVPADGGTEEITLSKLCIAPGQEHEAHQRTGGCVRANEIPEAWLTTAISEALQSLVGDAEPPPENWTRVRQSIEALASLLSCQKEHQSC